MQEIKRLGVLSTARIMALFGIIAGILYAFLLVIASNVTGIAIDPTITGVVGNMSWLLILAFPLYFAVYFFVLGIIISACYNLFAKWIGGIKINIAGVSEKERGTRKK